MALQRCGLGSTMARAGNGGSSDGRRAGDARSRKAHARSNLLLRHCAQRIVACACGYVIFSIIN